MRWLYYHPHRWHWAEAEREGVDGPQAQGSRQAHLGETLGGAGPRLWEGGCVGARVSKESSRLSTFLPGLTRHRLAAKGAYVVFLG